MRLRSLTRCAWIKTTTCENGDSEQLIRQNSYLLTPRFYPFLKSPPARTVATGRLT
jgi:hypothetical protein